ncbi:MAG TPA: TIGR03560 family F420-dependent LLM class oxidoreductase [Microthrixaceae bacterium]|nr:TIGR03560 family F420-dependent LLM class oxidoreductase [Microthrixaceae bacterium]
MLLSIWPNPQQPISDLLEVVRYADTSGWHAVYMWDHFMGDDGDFGSASVPTLESTAVLAALAMATINLRIGSLVFGNTYRHPAVLANWAATVDQISAGRLILGLGAGWQQNEHQQYGIDLPRPGVRIEQLDEACQVIRMLLDEAESTFEGRHYSLKSALCEPKPVQEKVPLLIGGKGDRMLRLVARRADQWNMWSLPETFRQRSEQLDRACEDYDRDPATIHRSTQALVLVTNDIDRAMKFEERVAPRAAVAGPPGRFAEMVEAWRRVGVDEVIVPDMFLGRGSQRAENLDALMAATRT